MTQNTKKSASPNSKTEAEAKSVDGNAGGAGEKGHDHMSHTKAGSTKGAGGGKKQERQH